jgi:hypothetical protein
MNRIPAAAHLGKTIHAVLGSAAAKVQPAFEHVFATGQLLSNFEVTAELPSRMGAGHWNASYFPIKELIPDRFIGSARSCWNSRNVARLKRHSCA